MVAYFEILIKKTDEEKKALEREILYNNLVKNIETDVLNRKIAMWIPLKMMHKKIIDDNNYNN